MPLPVHIRPFRAGDAPALRALFHVAVHAIARPDYTPAQLQAWAPRDHDAAAWAERLRANQPWVAELVSLAVVAAPAGGALPGPAGAGTGNTVAGFADLQADGYIDQFFVAPAFAGQGVARALMAHLHAQAAQRGIERMWAHVSLTAEPFFAAQGFAVQERRQVVRAGVVLRNALMAKTLGRG
jgi:putative acetyltransferase